MADGLTTRPRASPSSRRRPLGVRRALLVRWRLVPWWARVLGVFLLSRIVSTALLVSFAGRQEANAWTLARPDYASFASIWDGHWYYIISAVGYPTTIPLTDTGHVAENAWAFMPAYPFLVRGLTELTGLSFATLAVVVSVVAAGGTSLLLYRLMRHVLPEGSALFAVVLFCVSPLSPLLQVAYAESMFLVLLCACLLLLLERRYLAMLPVVLVLSFTRPGSLALALAIGLHVVHRWWRARRGDEAFPRGEAVRASTAAVVTGLLGLAWPVVAGLVTGVPNAYAETELAWRSAYVGYGPLVPFAPWIEGANWWLPGGSGVALLGVVVVAFAVLLLSPAGRRIGVDLRLWSVAYALYLLAVFFPQSSTWRLLMPFFPLLGVLAAPRSRVWRVALVVLFVVGQYAWLYFSWWVDGYDWTPP
ncbi:hypothetical protein EDF38_2311 [Frigoribacterium sp. PhB160]|uniref:hypothetical protein n=1 Tax=Frigoribacterium sp. PhB160 TaxID=2485192 RepID=UPI000F485C26|nr:hypothetical protein [Frigoribacterium sp. PhB160]ROS59462.1 hypothetical protein EDF38_2311 [Frigoribacterium sp. PhB160]